MSGIKRVHFIGIGGYGMSALAFVLLQGGYTVSGSDLRDCGLTRLLKQSGARIFTGHREEQLGDAELVVYSTAIPGDNPELLAARERGLPLWHRSELLAAVFNEKAGVAIAGAHGKTTTTAMAALLLVKGGLDPTAIIGGEVSFFGGNARLGKGRHVVAEACESDHSFMRYRPELALVTNIEADHLEHYGGDFARLITAYRAFINNVKAGGIAVLCADDPVLRELRPQLRPSVVTYGFDETADFRAGKVTLEGLGSRFPVYQNDKYIGEFSLRVPGRHNVLNALGAMAAAHSCGVDLRTMGEALHTFNGVKRRFEIVGEAGDIMVVDDYAHHPTEIRATLEAAHQSGRRVICVFQPHRYTRTHFLWSEFLQAFHKADILLLDDIYAAGEEPIPGISAGRLAEKLQGQGHRGAHFLSGKEQILAALQQISRAGDLVITMGAGDIWLVGCRFLDALAQQNGVAMLRPGGAGC
ncbi:MAG: UDP-N-acetylmuramate--L-alanine ligase [Bacillota bacterium]